MAATAPSVTTAVENHRTAISSHTGRGLGLACAGGFVQDSSAGSALRNAAAALSMSAMSRVGFGARGWSGAVRFPQRAAALRRRKAAKIVQRGVAVRARQGKQARLMPRHGAHLSVAPLNP